MSLFVWRLLRNAVYQVIGVLRPGWRRALVANRVMDAYADKGTLNMSLYSDPKFGANLRYLEEEARRLRRGGEPGSLVLPYDFPPGAQALVREMLE